MNRVASLVSLALVALLLSAPGCKKRPRSHDIPARLGLTGGTLLFEEDFEKGLSAWTTTPKNWRVEDGRLYTGDKQNENEGLWLNAVPLPANVRIEFEATSVKGNNALFEGDIKVELGGRDLAHASGYVVIFGGWKNTVNAIAKGDEHGDGRLAVDSARKVKEGVTYRFVIVRLNSEVRWYLAEQGGKDAGEPELLLQVRDDDPALGGDFGFNNWNSRVYFDKLRLFAL
ncbi:MAG: hypothetical protein FJ109_14250 [Deltaproteobacteria bacterium]|nr:hypothetical protein [Deltaproteobacteria bacterium]